VINQTEPSDVTVTLTYAYTALGRQINLWTRKDAAEPDSERLRKWREWTERRDAWQATSADARQRIVLEALADRQLSVTEISDRIEHEHPEYLVGYQSLQPTIKRMTASRELVRQRVERGARVLFVYTRPPMSAEIQELERRLDA
jgi:hypothetical protein